MTLVVILPLTNMNDLRSPPELLFLILLVYNSFMSLIRKIRYSAEFIVSVEYENQADIENVNASNIKILDISNIKELGSLTKKGDADDTHAKSVSVTESS